jgi:hypothetical protein
MSVSPNGAMPVRLRLLRYLNYFLAACVVLSDGLYLCYLESGHHMARYWSGLNSILLGLFMLSLAMLMKAKEWRWIAATILVIGFVNLAVGVLFFL